ncbi:hypothetical protein KJ032_26300, partial [Salmonella enterica subsp. enterica serovar Typhimurium]|nr:hypothetical protein [Salmonella enterica subsp. enterica serovar Typhimurium]
MDFASIQAQLANLTSQLSQFAERTTMQNVPTFSASYRQGYQANQYPQSDWSDHSNSMWWEAQQVQQETYWQPYEDSYAPPQPPPQSSHPNSGISNYYKEVIQQLNSLEQGREAQPFQQDAFWQPIEY